MKIRCITQFTPLSWPFNDGDIASAARMLTDARFRFRDAGFEVQSSCLATPPFLDVLGNPDPILLVEFAKKLEGLAHRYNIDFVSIGPVIATTPLSLLMPIYALPQVIEQTEKIVSGVLFADDCSGINLAAAHAFAKTILTVAQNTPNSAGNLRLAALANVRPHLPFVPTAYQQGNLPSFAIATEAADLALTAISSTRTLTDARKRLVESIESSCSHLLKIADGLVDDHHVQFSGIDFSLAPFVQQARSIGHAVEKLGITTFGSSGTPFAISFLTHAVQQANIPHTGFSGIMLPVLGDSTIAQRAEEGQLTVNDMLLYSASGSSGPDLIPIPGDTTPEEIATLYLDMAVLAISRGKPMSSRLLPVPNKKAGQKVEIKSDQIAAGHVLPVKKLGETRLFEQNSFVSLTSF